MKIRLTYRQASELDLQSRWLPERLYGVNFDGWIIDQRRWKRIMRKVRRRRKAIKTALTYTVTRGEIADNLYSTRRHQ